MGVAAEAQYRTAEAHFAPLKPNIAPLKPNIVLVVCPVVPATNT